VKLLDLIDFLAKSGVRTDAVSYNGIRTAPEQYCIEQAGEVWRVYYFERGKKTNIVEFSDVEGACDYLLKLLKADPTVVN
jgi:hypothetical protein